MNELHLIAYSAAAGAALAATDAASISRIGIEVARKRLGVSSLAIYDQQAFVEEEKRDREQQRQEGGNGAQ